MKLLRLIPLVAVLVLSACGDMTNPLTPKSGGRPYEVLVVTDGVAGKDIIGDILTQDTPGLPQGEPLFDVSFTDNAHFDRAARMGRSIVIVTEDLRRFTSTRIKYEKNVWAAPQIIVYVNTPSADALRRDMKKAAHMLTDLLTRAEMNTTLSVLNKRDNPKAEKMVKEMFGIDMKIPSDMKSWKRGQDFIWLSDNAVSGMRNICVYSYAGDRLEVARFETARDSIMRTNIPGERPGMCMQTVGRSVTAVKRKEKNRTIMVCRGLWEMRGDAMGGPFVAAATVDTARGRIIVTEAFVYAPEMKKRNLLRQTEAAIYSPFIQPREKE